MKNLKKILLIALAALPLLFASDILFAQKSTFGRKTPATSASKQNQQANSTNDTKARETETNTITVVNTDEIKIVTKKDGKYAFQLRNLDILWGTRAAMCGAVAVILLIITLFTKRVSRQNLMVSGFLCGCSLMTSIYPLGISFMIMEWNRNYGLAAMGGGAVLTFISIMLALNLKAKADALGDEELAAVQANRKPPMIFGQNNDGPQDGAGTPPPPPPPPLSPFN